MVLTLVQYWFATNQFVKHTEFANCSQVNSNKMMYAYILNAPTKQREQKLKITNEQLVDYIYIHIYVDVNLLNLQMDQEGDNLIIVGNLIS